MAAITYNSIDVNVMIDSSALTGFAEGTMISCSRNEDRIVPYVGNKGEYAYSVTNNDTGTIEVTLQQQSAGNYLLQSLANKRQKFSVQVSDANVGGFIAGGMEAIIITDPATERSGEIEAVTWSIYVFDYTNVPAKNTTEYDRVINPA